MSVKDSVGSRLLAWKRNPIKFVHECLNVERISSQQKEALEIATQSNKLSIRSGHGTGKDAFASWMILWFLVTRPYSKVVCTAPTSRQLSDVLWSEIHKWFRNSDIIQGEFTFQRDKIYYNGEGGKQGWWARAVSPSVKSSKEEQAETLAGFHGEHLLIVVDEASGVSDPVFIPLEGALTQDDNRVLLIGNPTKMSGYFYDTHKHEKIKLAWTTLHWNSEDSENVKGDMVEYFATKYGVDSAIYKIRVLGEFAEEDSDTLIPLQWALDCVGQDLPEDMSQSVHLGVDIARYGADSSVFLPRRGNKILPWEEHRKLDSFETQEKLLDFFQKTGAVGAAIDAVGIGGMVYDNLMHNTRGIASNLFHPIHAQWQSSDKTVWKSLRDELWWRVRDKCELRLFDFPAGDQGKDLAYELASLKAIYNETNGQKYVESKKDLKKRGGHSPNIADALTYSEMFHGHIEKVYKPADNKYDRFVNDEPLGNIPTHLRYSCV